MYIFHSLTLTVTSTEAKSAIGSVQMQGTHITVSFFTETAQHVCFSPRARACTWRRCVSPRTQTHSLILTLGYGDPEQQEGGEKKEEEKEG